MSHMLYAVTASLTFDPSSAPDTQSFDDGYDDDNLVFGYTAPDSRSSHYDLDSCYPAPHDPWNDSSRLDGPALNNDYPPAPDSWLDLSTAQDLASSSLASHHYQDWPDEAQYSANAWGEHDVGIVPAYPASPSEAYTHALHWEVYPGNKVSQESMSNEVDADLEFSSSSSWAASPQPAVNVDQTSTGVPSSPTIINPPNILDKRTPFVAQAAFLGAVAPTALVQSHVLPDNDPAADSAAVRDRLRQRRLAARLRDDTSLRRTKGSLRRSFERRNSRRPNQELSENRRKPSRRVRDKCDDSGNDSDATVRASRSDDEGGKNDEDLSARATEDAYVEYLLGSLNADQIPTILRLHPENMVRIIACDHVRTIILDMCEGDDGCTLTVCNYANRYRTFVGCAPYALTLLHESGVLRNAQQLIFPDRMLSPWYKAMKGMHLPFVTHVFLRVSGQAHAAFWAQPDFVLILRSLRVWTFAGPGDRIVLLSRPKFEHVMTRVVAFAGPIEPMFERVVVPGIHDFE